MFCFKNKKKSLKMWELPPALQSDMQAESGSSDSRRCSRWQWCDLWSGKNADKIPVLQNFAEENDVPVVKNCRKTKRGKNGKYSRT